MFSGIREAVDEYNDLPDSRLHVELDPRPYADEEAGLQVLLEALSPTLAEPSIDTPKIPKLHVLMGPSDSGVFLNSEKFAKDLDREKVVVFSPVVTADVGNKKAGWLFRANVSVNERARKMYDQLNAEGYNNFAVVYSAGGFGDKAEAAFRTLLSPEEEALYLALRYSEPQGLRNAAVKLEAERPSAVGLFGPPEHVKLLHNRIRAVSHGWVPYNPLIFAITDASTICLPDVRFVSVAVPNPDNCAKREATDTLSENATTSDEDDAPVQAALQDNANLELVDEFTGLGYDAARHMLRIAESIPGQPGTDSWGTNFQVRLAASLRDPAEVLPRTNMRFSSMVNISEPEIYRLLKPDAGEAKGSAAAPVFQPVTLGELSVEQKLRNLVDIRQRRFGLMPIFNLILVVTIVSLLTFFDVRKSYTGSLLLFLWRWTFLKLVFFNVLVAVAVLFALAELGDVRWDNTYVALSVAFGYTMMLKTSIFETSAGQAFGLSQVYEKVLQNINRRLMVLRYELEGKRVYFLSYTNSRSGLREVLERVYREGEDTDKVTKKLESLDREVAAVPSEIEKRRVYAQRLLHLMNWGQIERARLVPNGMKEYELFDPAILLREAASYSTHQRPENREIIKQLVSDRMDHLAQESPDDYVEIRDKLESRIAKATTERGRNYLRLDWLLVQQVMSLEDLQDRKFVPPDFNPLSLWASLRVLNARKLSPLSRKIDKMLQPASAHSEGEEESAEERRETRRVPVSGTATLICGSESDPEADPLAADLVDLGRGGVGMIVKDGKTFARTHPAYLYHVVIEEEPLALKCNADCRDHHESNGGVRVNLQWLNQDSDAEGKIVEFLQARTGNSG
jgi:hypothetical protein